MLTHPTLELLHDLGLHGMAKGFRDMVDNPESAALGHAEWLGILLDRESTLRQQKRFESRAKTAKLRHLAAVEDVDYRTPRGLDRKMFLKLAGCDWTREKRHSDAITAAHSQRGRYDHRASQFRHLSPPERYHRRERGTYDQLARARRFLRINGSFAAPTIRPATLPLAGRAQLAAGDDVSRLLPSLQPFARRSPCLSCTRRWVR